MTLLLPDGWKGEVVDLSVTGLRVRSLALLPPQSEVEGTLVLEDGKTIPLKSVVVWTTPPDYASYVPAEFGLELVEVPEDYVAAVARLFADAG